MMERRLPARVTALPAIAAVFVAAVVAGTLFPDDFPGPAAGVAMAAVLAACAAAQGAAGRGLGEDSRWGQVLRDSAVVEGAFALFALAFVVGATTAPALGWATLLAVPVVALVWASRRLRRRQHAMVADRADLAVTRGWRFSERDGLGRRWKGTDDETARRAVGAFGVVDGEISGVSFTAFDSMSNRDDGLRCTTWAARLPVAYPPVRMWALSPDAAALVREGWSCADADRQVSLSRMAGWLAAGPGPPPRADASIELIAESDDPAFAAALATPEVLRATRETRLGGWRIAGADLLWHDRRDGALPAAEVERVAAALVRVARSLPPDVAHRWGTPAPPDPRSGARK